jgi:hypothetical protein
MKTYDLLITLGSQPDSTSWRFPDQVYTCLDRTVELFNDNRAPHIAVSGKWSITFDALGITQPFRECDELAAYLINHGVPKESIFKEGDSQDTISNLYYLKTQMLIPNNCKNLLFVVASFRIARLKFLCERILGPDYNIEFESVPCDETASYNESHTFKIQKEFLEPMKNGEHEWLADKFYTAPMYQYWTTHNKELGLKE